MNYIETFKTNINNIIMIKKLAKEKKVKYEIAKIMYNDGKNDISEEQAKEILQTINTFKIPYFMVKELKAINDTKSPIFVNMMENIYNKIIEYANKKYINDLRGYIDVEVLYGEKIVLLTKITLSIDVAIKLFDLQVKIEMKRTGLSETAAAANLLRYHLQSDFTEIEFLEKAMAFNKEDPIDETIVIKKYITESGDYKCKKVHGIFIASKTTEELERLESIIEKIYKKNNPQFLKRLSKEADLNDLLITDIKIDEDNDPYYNPNNKIIKIDEKRTDEEIETTIYHEATHFLDDVIKYETEEYDSYSSNNPKIQEIFDKINQKKKKYIRTMSLLYLTDLNAKKYTNIPYLNQKWLKEIKEKHPYESEEDINLFLEQKRMYERKRFKELKGYIIDIYDSMAKGKIHLATILQQGHGVIYFHEQGSQLREFIANIGAIINYGGKDILNYEFGEETAKELITIYDQFLQTENYKEENEHSKTA